MPHDHARTLPSELVEGLDVRSATPVSGGDIAETYRLDTGDGPLFCKVMRRPTSGLFAREAAGLGVLRDHAPSAVGVPEVVRQSDSGLVLEWIDIGGRATGATEADLGTGLAELHRTTREVFGALDGERDGFIGAVTVDQTPTDSWPEFYLERRLRPLVHQAVARGGLDPHGADLLDRLAPRIVDLCGPAEVPALVHGDLWGGNRLVDRAGRNWLIDPAAHYAHREIDLAMMQLFGGFSARTIEAYDDAFPLAEGWRDRAEWYQVVPLLVHAILFGGGYGESVMRVLRRYA